MSFCQYRRCLSEQIGEWNPICFNTRTILARIFAWEPGAIVSAIQEKRSGTNVSFTVKASFSQGLCRLPSFTFPLLLAMQNFWQSAGLKTYIICPTYPDTSFPMCHSGFQFHYAWLFAIAIRLSKAPKTAIRRSEVVVVSAATTFTTWVTRQEIKSINTILYTVNSYNYLYMCI